MRGWKGVLVGVAAAAAVVAPGSNAAAAVDCGPWGSAPHFAGQAPSPDAVLGFPVGVDRELTTDETYRYLDALDLASPRVVTGRYGTTAEGRALRYAIVGDADAVTPDGLRRARALIGRLQDPSTPASGIDALATEARAFLYVGANVHGTEESGTEASLRILYELADRDDCAAATIRRHALTIVLPIQNPDGRELGFRRNSYGFDLNRDWFARTQPETDGKLEVLRRYPPQLFDDLHEFGYEGYLFPPNSNPFYHEVTDAVTSWTQDLYPDAIERVFDRAGIPYFHKYGYDYFSPIFGDTVPANGFQAAGMTFEKYQDDPLERRAREHYTSSWTTLGVAATHAPEILARWHRTWVEAVAEGQAGTLEPNVRLRSDQQPIVQVPTAPLRQYFLLSTPGKGRELSQVVRLLQRMDVQVYRLTAPLSLASFKPYGRPAGPATLPAGTIWVPLAQRQKHWVQTALNEDPFQPVPWVYSTPAWSLPFMYDLAGGSSGEVVAPPAELVAPVAASRPALGHVPRVGLYGISHGDTAWISYNFARWMLEQGWRMPYRPISSADIAAGALDDVDVLLVPDGLYTTALAELGAGGQRRLVDWVNAGGRYVGWRGGTRLAMRLGLATVHQHTPDGDLPGNFVRAHVDRSSRLAHGLADDAWVMFEYDQTLTADDPADVVVRFPEAGSPDWYVSGYSTGSEELGGTAVVVDEPVGDGGVTSFSVDPNYRAYDVGIQEVELNAVLRPVAPAHAPAAGSFERAAAEAAVAAQADRLPPLTRRATDPEEAAAPGR